MKGRTFFTIAILLLVLVGLMSPLNAGCGDNTATVPVSSTALLSDAVICKSFHQSTGPSDPTNSFAHNDPWVLCAVKLTDAPSSTRVKAAWFYQKSQKYSETQGIQGTKWLDFVLKPENLDIIRFAVGSYTVKLYLNGVEKFSLDFTVN